MIKNILTVIGCSVLLSACASSSVAWDTLEKESNAPSFCDSTFTDKVKIEACKIESIALKKAQSECVKDSNPDYCILMAEYSWNNFKDVVLTSAPTREHANMYPVFCGKKNKEPVLCSKL